MDIIPTVAFSAQHAIKTLGWRGFGRRLFLVLFAGLFLTAPVLAIAQNLQVVLETGSDDFRNASTFTIRLFLTGGIASDETFIVNRGETLNSGTRVVKMVPVVFPGVAPITVTAASVESFTLTFTGDKRPGHPFDEDDSWDLNSISMGFLRDDSAEADPEGPVDLIYNSAFDSSRPLAINSNAGLFSGKLVGAFKKFTNAHRIVEGPIRVNDTLPTAFDFTIRRIARNANPNVIDVQIGNVGASSGQLGSVVCEGPLILTTTARPNPWVMIGGIRSGISGVTVSPTAPVTVQFAAGSTTLGVDQRTICTVRAVGDRVTANDRSWTFFQ